MPNNKHITVDQTIEVLGDLQTKADARFRKSSVAIAEADLGTELANKINGKADAATTIAGYGITDAYTKTEVDNAIGEAQAAVLKPGGTLAAAGIVSGLLVEGNLGKVYNISEDFVTTADFVEGAGHSLPAGTNIYVINTAASGETAVYKFDVLSGEYGVATQSGNGLMSSTDKTKLDNADVTAYSGTGAISVLNHEISVAPASASTSGVGGAAGTMSAEDKEKLDNADVTAYSGTGAISVLNHQISVAAATTSTPGTMSAEDKAKLDGFEEATTTDIAAIKATIWPSA